MFYMRANEGTSTPTWIVAVDTETSTVKDRKRPNDSDQVFRLGVANIGRWRGDRWEHLERRPFRSPDQFWRWLEAFQQKKRTLQVWCHNLGFDLTVLDFWNRLDDGTFRVSTSDYPDPNDPSKRKRGFKGKMILEASPTYLSVLGRKGKVVFNDTFNYYHCSLAKLGASLGIAKIEGDVHEMTDEEALDRCTIDSYIVYAAVTSMMTLWRREDCGHFKPTIAACALQNWRHRYIGKSERRKPKKLLLEGDQETNTWERQGYYGGRVEAFYYGEIFDDPARISGERETAHGKKKRGIHGPIYELDVQSFYPSVMASLPYPWKRVERLVKPPVETLRKKLGLNGGMAEVLIDSSSMPYPVRREGRTFHACGRFTTHLCGLELQAAISRGHVRDCSQAIIYGLAYLFQEWVEYWWGQRQGYMQEGHEPGANFCKLIMNSLYGKFGQRGKKWMDRPKEKPISTSRGLLRWGSWIDGRKRFRSIAGNVQELVMGDDPAHVFPAISAFITSNARHRLNQIIDMLPLKSVAYVATDCLYVTASGYDELVRLNLIQDGVLGYFHLKDVYANGFIGGVNDFRLGDKVVRSGVPTRARNKVDGGWEGDQFERLPSILGRGPDGTVRIHHTKFSDLPKHFSNVVGVEGWAEPIRLGAS